MRLVATFIGSFSNDDGNSEDDALYKVYIYVATI